MRCVLWERNLHHSIRPEIKDGFLLPYHDLIDLGYEDGDRVLWGGAKRRGKVWQLRKSGSVADWVAWTKTT